MADEIPTWVRKRTCELINASCSADIYSPANISTENLPAYAFARYIMEHEEEPVDPLLIEAREIAAEACRQLNNASGAESIMAGKWDEQEGLVSTALRALRRGIELAKDGS